MTLLFKKSLASAAENLALDEAILTAADAGELPQQVLRLWQFEQTTVVLGRGSKAGEEADQPFCEAQQIPILRRCSGGATVVGGPGCLMYSLVLDLQQQPHWRNVDRVHQYVMETILSAAQQAVDVTDRPWLQFQGICDLTFGNRKFSGNSLRIARNHLLYHGTLLLAADVELIARCLRTPPRQPDYRQRRAHGEFITNLPADRETVEQHLAAAFQATEPLVDWPRERMQALVAERYGCQQWNFRH